MEISEIGYLPGNEPSKTFIGYTTEQILEEYFIEIKAGRDSTVKRVAEIFIKDRLKIESVDELQEIYPEYFL